MSLPAILWAMYEAPVPTNPTEKCVLMVLAEHADPKGRNAFPSWNRIAKIVGVSTRTIGSTLSSLQTKGLIRKGDQEIAEIAVRRRGKSRAYAPTVWDLVMAGSHAAATQDDLPDTVATDPSAADAESTTSENSQLAWPAESAGLPADGIGALGKSALQQACRSCRSADGCRQGCSLASSRREARRASGVKPASDEPSTSTKNMNPPPRALPAVITPRTSSVGSMPKASRGSRRDSVANVDGFVDAVRDALPPRLGRQSIGRSLERRCLALAAAGWTVEQITDSIRSRSWDGAGVGAAITWLSDLRHECPSAKVPAEQHISGRAELASRPSKQHEQAPSTSAAADSPARSEALRFAAEAAARARERRISASSV